MATKDYIKDIQDKEWPDLETIAYEYLLPEGITESEPLYLAQNMLEGVLLSPVPQYKECDIFNPGSQDMKQLVYYRLARSLKAQKHIPFLELSNYFDISDTVRMQIQIQPDFSYAISSEIISTHQAEFDKFATPIQEFPTALNTELSDAINKIIKIGKFDIFNGEKLIF